jgi:hypothetical protein
VYCWAQARGPHGEAEGWLEAPEGYAFTAPATVLSLERVLALKPKGALSPAMAFGADFVLDVPGVKRLAQLG